MTERISSIIACSETLLDGNMHHYLNVCYQDGQHEIWPFTNNSMAIIREDGRKLYDWYGRLVQFDDDVKRVIRPYGYEHSGDYRLSIRETFIVETKNGRQAIAELLMGQKENERQDTQRLPYFKEVLTGFMLSRPSILRLKDQWRFNEVDESIAETPILQTFFKNRCRNDPEKRLGQFIGVEDEESKSEPFVVIRPNIMRGLDGLVGSWIKNAIVDDRDTILTTPKKSVPARLVRNYLAEKIVSSNGGNTLTSAISFEDGSTRKIQTDTEIVDYAASTFMVGTRLDLYWYFIDG